MIPIKIIAVFVLILLISTTVNGQDLDEQDTLTINLDQRNIKNPKTATLLAVILPGSGQVYNGKTWKVPLLYGGIATNIYFLEFNNRRYQMFRKALIEFDAGGDSPFPNLNRDGLVRNVNYWRRNRDFVFLVFLGIYALNIIDAQVDAHLSGFDVSEDLTLIVEPSYESMTAGGNVIGVSLKLKF